MSEKHVLLQVRLTPKEHKDLFDSLECFAPVYNRRGQATDLIRPVIEKFVEAHKHGKGLEFSNYIKSYAP